MRGKWVKFIATISVLSCLFWLFGLGWVLFDYFGGPKSSSAETASSQVSEELKTDEIPPEQKEGLYILAIGDSLTRGIGDTTGKGYVGYLTDQLKEKSDQEMVVNNLGISGQTSSELVNLVGQKEVQRQIQTADVILITTGGNDLFQGGQTLINLNFENITKLQETYLQNLEVILSSLRALNPEAKVFLIGLYNPFIQIEAELTSKIVQEWNHKTDAFSIDYLNTVFVPTYDLFQLKTENYLYTDNFHPNAEGYKLMAERLAASIKVN